MLAYGRSLIINKFKPSIISSKINMFSKVMLGRAATQRFSMRQPTQLLSQPRRFFDLHEFHSKKLMGSFGINVQKGALAYTGQEAADIAATLSNEGGLVVKAQV